MVIMVSLPLLVMLGCTATVPVGTNMRQSEVVPLSTPALDSVIHKIIREPIRVTKCRRTQRDLTIHWATKEYLCSHEQRLSALQDHNAAVFHDTPHRSQPLAVSQDIPKQLIARQIEDTPPSPTVERLQTVNSGGTPACAEPTQSVPTKQTPIHIPFAHNREVLGPVGTEQSLSLVSKVNDAHRVTLRGLYEQNEIVDPTPLNRERFSVGRSLSVRKLWSEAGVDPAKVTILHHQNDRSGRTVEVILHVR
ncbi:MAG: hypothetical protein AAES65_22230 [Candidatus Thiodiazotropha sp. (ex. Lucinoma kazani)]